MKRYFDLPDSKLTLCVGVKPGSAAALATPETIRDDLKQSGIIREVELEEYRALTRKYTEGGATHEA